VIAPQSHLYVPTYNNKLVFSAAAADFDQDGHVDLFLGAPSVVRSSGS
jgi:hypothetical protein